MLSILTDYSLFLSKKVHTSKGMLMPVDMGIHLKKAEEKRQIRQQMCKTVEPFPGKKGKQL